MYISISLVSASYFATAPFPQELRQNEIIDRLKAFTLTPEPGTVMNVSAAESRPLSIAYSADSLSYGGVHDLPVLVSHFLGVWSWPSSAWLYGNEKCLL